MKKQLKQILAEQVKLLSGHDNWPIFDLPSFSVEYPKEKNHGDVSTNIALVLATRIRKNPIEIGEGIIEKIQNSKHGALFKNIAFAPPGFINFFFHPNYYSDQISEVVKNKHSFGQNHVGNNQEIIVEFISANPTGPLHLGNGRGAFLGDSLSNILEWSGYRITREYYFNDRGEQIELLAKSVTMRYLQQRGMKMSYPDECYQGRYIEQLAQDIGNELDLDGVKIDNSGKMEQLREVIKDRALQKMVDLIQQLITKQIKIKFDVWFSEQSLYKNGHVEHVLKFLRKRNLVYEKEGAVWMRTSEFGDDKDRVLIKSDSNETYFLSDIAYHWHKLEKRKAHKTIDIWGADHHGYVGRLQAAVKAMGHAGKLDIILVQLVQLISGGQELRMSKRSGTFVTLNELVEEVGSDVARFFFLMYDANSPMEFDLDLAKEHSEKNPVFYVQYAHARISSIKREIIARNLVASKKGGVALSAPAELALAREILKLPSLIEHIAQTYQVHHLGNYCLDVARAFHTFYNQHRVIERDAINSSRFTLVEATGIALRTALKLLGVRAPEKM